MNQSILMWLDRTAAAFPEKTAFTDNCGSITFRQVDGISKVIGTYLSSRVSAPAPVVVMSGRKVITPAVFLGVVRGW